MNTEIIFKRGLARNLPESAEDGTFYLTTDTERLYVGLGTEMVELNRSVRMVSSRATLPDGGMAEGDFCYAINDNILFVYHNMWLPIKGAEAFGELLTHGMKISNNTGNIAGITLSSSDGIVLTDDASGNIRNVNIALEWNKFE